MVFVMRVANDEAFIYEYLNRSAIDKTIFDKSIIDKSLREVNPEETATFLEHKYKQAVAKGSRVTFRDAFVSEEGENHLETTLNPLFDEGNCTHIVAVL